MKQFYDFEPVFNKYSIVNEKVKIYFDIISYNQSSSQGKMKIVLKKIGKNELQGLLFEPKKEAETISLKKHSNYMDTKPFEGTWFHSPIVLGKERIHVLRCSKDDTGRLRFEFLKQYYSYEPIFTEYSIRKNQIEINFKLTGYGTGHDSKYNIKYILKAQGSSLVGKMYESWREPVEVTLTSSI